MGVGRLVAIAVAALLVVPASAEAARRATLGPPLPQTTPLGRTCIPFVSCTFVNDRLEDGLTRAPFSGKVRRWRIQGAEGDFRLQVLKRVAGGKFKALRQSARVTLDSESLDEVILTSVNLAIRRGQFVAIRMYQDATMRTLQDAGPGDCYKGIVPGLAIGASDEPNPSYGVCERVTLYNARLVG